MINRTKLFLPKSPEPYVARKEIHAQLTNSINIPFVLVSAPMGYGKSSLIADWLCKSNKIYFWYSLDENDNEFYQFINYISQSIPQSHKQFHEKIEQLLKAQNPAPLQSFIDLFANEYHDCTDKVYLVFDDYHLIQEQRINNFLTGLLKFPLSQIQIIVLTRADPPFPLPIWKLKNKMLEIRANDLVFGIEEIQEFVTENSQLKFSRDQLTLLQQNTEGWISGIKLWILSKKNEQEITKAIHSSRSNTFELIQDLVLNILNKYPRERSIILKLSILDKFNKDIVEEITQTDKKNQVDKVFSLLKRSNLFLIPLDHDLHWYRLHHMFQEYLHQILIQEFEKEDYLRLHKNASAWFCKNGFLFESIKHAIKAEDFETAITIFSSIRQELLNNNKWSNLSNIFKLFPDEKVKKSIELRLIQSWLLIHQGKVFEMFESFDQINELIEADKSQQNIKYRAEFNSLLPYKTYNLDQDFSLCIKQCEYAIKHLENDKIYQQGYAWIFLIGSLQITGEYAKGVKLVHIELNKTKSKALKQNLLLVLCFIHWMEGILPELNRTSNLLINLGEYNFIPEASANGHYFAAAYHLVQNEMQEAKAHFELFCNLRYATIGSINYMGCIAYTQVLIDLGDRKEIQKILLIAKEDVQISENQYFIKLIDLANAEFHLSQNQIDKAWQLSKGTEQLPNVPFSNVYAPILTYLKVLLYKGELKTAYDIIQKTSLFLNKTHNRLFKVYLDLYEILYYVEIKEEMESLSRLKKLVNQAAFLNIKRPFIELFDYTNPLLNQLKEEFKNNSFFESILHPNAKFQNAYKLSRRELEILPLLTQSDKEISEQLFIAVKTVKRHNSSIFKILGVKKRLDAFHKAKNLNLI